MGSGLRRYTSLRRRSRSIARVSGAVASLGVAIAILASSDASASFIKITPPLSGSRGFASNQTRVTGCYQGISSASVSTKLGQIAIWSQVGSSPSGGCNGHGRVSTTAGFLGPTFSLTSSGSRKVVYVWNVHVSVGASVSCPYVRYQRELFGNLFDVTTGLWVLGGASPTNAIKGFPPGCAHLNISNPHDYVQFAANLTGGDVYQFFTGGTAIARFGGGPGTGEFSSLNATLLRISVV